MRWKEPNSETLKENCVYRERKRERERRGQKEKKNWLWNAIWRLNDARFSRSSRGVGLLPSPSNVALTIVGTLSSRPSFFSLLPLLLRLLLLLHRLRTIASYVYAGFCVRVFPRLTGRWSACTLHVWAFPFLFVCVLLSIWFNRTNAWLEIGHKQIACLASRAYGVNKMISPILFASFFWNGAK